MHRLLAALRRWGRAYWALVWAPETDEEQAERQAW